VAPNARVEDTTMNPAPPPAARPPIGMHVVVSSTRRDKDTEGKVVAHDDVGVRVRCSAEIGEVGVVRFYPWGQIAFLQWPEPAFEAAVEGVPAEGAEQDADFEVDVAVGLATPAQLRERLEAWRSVPGEECWDESFVRSLTTDGFPVESYVAREADTRDVVPAETGWSAGVASFGVDSFAAAINDDRAPGDDFLKSVDDRPGGQMLLRPEVRGYRLPAAILACYPNVDLAMWAAINHTPGELSAMYSLHEGDFAAYLSKLRQGEQAGGDSDGDGAWATP
jgi:hypothetical protein